MKRRSSTLTANAVGQQNSGWVPAARVGGGTHAAANRLDDVSGPHLRFLIDATEVFAENADRHELNAAEKQQRQDQRREARHVFHAMPEDRESTDAGGQVDDPADGGEEGRREPGQEDQRERRRRKIEDAIERQLQKLMERVLRLTGGPGGSFVDASGLPEAGPCPKATDEPVLLGQAVQHAHHAPVHQRKVAAVQLHLDIGQQVINSVEAGIGKTLEGAFLTLRSDSVNHVETLTPERDHLEDHLGRILQIGVDDGHGVAGRVLEAGRHRGLVSEVSGE